MKSAVCTMGSRGLLTLQSYVQGILFTVRMYQSPVRTMAHALPRTSSVTLLVISFRVNELDALCISRLVVLSRICQAAVNRVLNKFQHRGMPLGSTLRSFARSHASVAGDSGARIGASNSTY